MFINFSNHPSFNWSDSQKEAAGKYGDILDVAFPSVPAEADETVIDGMAEDCVRQICSIPDVEAVMVQGEFTLTYKVVIKLKEKGMTVVSACTKRDVSEKTDKNGEIVKESRFVFVRFREY